MKNTGRPRQGQEKHRTRSIACRITQDIRDGIYDEAERQKTTVTEIMNDAFEQYLNRRRRARK